MENKEKEIREKLKKAIDKLFTLFEEYEAQFGNYTSKESLLADLFTESELKALTNKKPNPKTKSAAKTTPKPTTNKPTTKTTTLTAKPTTKTTKTTSKPAKPTTKTTKTKK